MISGPNTGANAASFSFGGIDEVTAPERLAFECRLDDGQLGRLLVAGHLYGHLRGAAHVRRARDRRGREHFRGRRHLHGSRARVDRLLLRRRRSPLSAQTPVARPHLRAARSRSRKAGRPRPPELLGKPRCKGVVTLATARPRARQQKPRREARDGDGSASARGRAKKVNVRLSRKMYRLVKRLRRVPSIVVVKDRDSAGPPTNEHAAQS